LRCPEKSTNNSRVFTGTLGATNPVPIDVPTRTDVQPLVLALGKDRRAYLLDRNNLGGIGRQLISETVSERSILAAVYPADSGVYVAFRGEGASCSAQDNGLTVLKIEAGSPPKMTTAWCGAPKATTDCMRSEATRASQYSPGAKRLSGVRRFQTLIAARLYVAAEGRIYAFTF
jgi:hypothetical protein